MPVESCPDPLAQRRGDVLILDGGLATHIETLGENIDHSLWSARCLALNPSIIRQAHTDFFTAGAEVAITASYQAHLDGFRSLGLSKAEALDAMKLSVQLAKEAAVTAGVPQSIIAGSLGCYGASLHNGAEFTGKYPKMNESDLLEWHLPRALSLVSAGCDVLACETIPCLKEARAIINLLKELRFPAWITFACSSETEVNSGESFSECINAIADCEYVIGAGINCTRPKYVAELINLCRRNLPPEKHIIVYPNSGEVWDGETHSWSKTNSATADKTFIEMACHWVALGADCVGGCCLTSPNTIAALRKAFPKKAATEKLLTTLGQKN
jgi:homocysteine S-methyltransferase